MNTRRIETAYRPVACASYERYELAIMQRRRLRLVWTDGERVHDQVITPLDLRTAAGQEYLVLRRPDGVRAEVRLDRIHQVEVPE